MMEWIGGVLCFSLGSRLRGKDVGGGGSAVSPSPCPSPIEGEGMLETRKKPGAVFGPVFARERSWICASAVERRRPV